MAVTVTCGPYHPHLERALLDDVGVFKRSDPLAPALIVVPSDTLKRQIAAALTLESGHSFLNLSIATFHELSQRLHQEAVGCPARDLVDEEDFEELMRLLLARRHARDALSAVAATRGGATALWQTLRDLKDGGVPPALLVDAVGEGVFPGDDVGRLSSLVGLYRDVLDAARERGWLDYTDVDMGAVASAPRSRFLSSQRFLAYYGFYDLTHVQSEILRAVGQSFDTKVYFAANPGDPDWIFAERFRRRYLWGLAATAPRVLSASAPEHPVSIQLASCSGTIDEVLACAKSILNVVEHENMDVSDIGIVARSLAPYTDVIAREFSRHHIPFVTTGSRPLNRFPLAVAAARLLSVAEGDPLREDVIGVLTSPWCRLDGLVSADLDLHVWDDVARSAGIVRGFDAWDRLNVDADSGLDRDTDMPRASRGAQTSALWRAVDRLRRICQETPETATALEHARAWQLVLERVFGLIRDIPGRAGEPGDAAVANAVLEAFAAAERLDGFGPMTRQEYLAVVRRRVERTVLGASDPGGRGVRVMDAASARGISFRVLFVLGMNNGVFPRVIREDAFLPDRDRRIIEDTLGYKVPEKFAGYEEERLLFAALVGSARERLAVFTQRADDAGRASAPSWYLGRFQMGEHPVAVIHVPRRARDKVAVSPFNRIDDFTPREAAVLAALFEDSATVVSQGPYAKWFERATRCRTSIESWSPSLSPFDGDVGEPTDWIHSARAAGYTATELADYAQCPWRYFVIRVLECAALSDAEVRGAPTARDWGVLAHEVMARVTKAVEPSQVPQLWREACARWARGGRIGYPAVWRWEVERLGSALAAVAADDAAERAESRYEPVEHEVLLRGELDGDPRIPIRGRVDRLDRSSDGRVRIIDWKFRMGGGVDRRERPDVAALRGRSLQPPLYEALGREHADRFGGAPDVVLYNVSLRDGVVERVPYAPNARMTDRILETVGILVRGIEDGLFPMMPGSICERCEAAAACRRHHRASRSRAERDSRAARVSGLSRLPVNEKGPE